MLLLEALRPLDSVPGKGRSNGQMDTVREQVSPSEPIWNNAKEGQSINQQKIEMKL